jgi:hypothetical protein
LSIKDDGRNSASNANELVRLTNLWLVLVVVVAAAAAAAAAVFLNGHETFWLIL